MKIKIAKGGLQIPKVGQCKAGTIVDISDQDAKSLISRGIAIEVLKNEKKTEVKKMVK